MPREEEVVYLPDPVCLERRLKMEAIFNSVSDGILSVDGELKLLRVLQEREFERGVVHIADSANHRLVARAKPAR